MPAVGRRLDRVGQLPLRKSATETSGKHWLNANTFCETFVAAYRGSARIHSGETNGVSRNANKRVASEVGQEAGQRRGLTF